MVEWDVIRTHPILSCSVLKSSHLGVSLPACHGNSTPKSHHSTFKGQNNVFCVCEWMQHTLFTLIQEHSNSTVGCFRRHTVSHTHTHTHTHTHMRWGDYNHLNKVCVYVHTHTHTRTHTRTFLSPALSTEGKVVRESNSAQPRFLTGLYSTLGLYFIQPCISAGVRWKLDRFNTSSSLGPTSWLHNPDIAICKSPEAIPWRHMSWTYYRFMSVNIFFFCKVTSLLYYGITITTAVVRSASNSILSLLTFAIYICVTRQRCLSIVIKMSACVNMSVFKTLKPTL